MNARASAAPKTAAVAGGDSSDSQPKSWPELRRQPCPAARVAVSEACETEGAGPELHAYASESWFTAEGARQKLRRLERAGLPRFTNWRFITLTMAKHSGHPFDAYMRGKDRLRRFLARLRRAVGCSFRWCWKLEFHDDGFAHWHLLVEYTKRIPLEMLEAIESWWGLGRINVRRVKRRDIFYVFKYVAKCLDGVPEWIAHHKGRIRVFQASSGFYTRRPRRQAKRLDPLFCLVRMDLHTRLGWDSRKAVLVSYDHRGQRRARVVKLRTTFSALLQLRAFESLRLGRQLAAPGVVNISQLQAMELMYEHKQYAGLAGIPADAFTEWRPLPEWDRYCGQN